MPSGRRNGNGRRRRSRGNRWQKWQNTVLLDAVAGQGEVNLTMGALIGLDSAGSIQAKRRVVLKKILCEFLPDLVGTTKPVVVQVRVAGVTWTGGTIFPVAAKPFRVLSAVNPKQNVITIKPFLETMRQPFPADDVNNRLNIAVQAISPSVETRVAIRVTGIFHLLPVQELAEFITPGTSSLEGASAHPEPVVSAQSPPYRPLPPIAERSGPERAAPSRGRPLQGYSTD